MKRAHRRAVVTVACAVVIVGGCSSESGEPAGLAAVTSSPESVAEPTAEPTTAPTSEPSATAQEPDPSFTQPWVPGDPSVIALPETLSVEDAGDLDEDEQAVVDSLGHAMAAWDAMLFGADPDQAGLSSWFGGDLLTSLVRYSLDSVTKQRVTVGSPTRVALHDVTVGGDEASIDVCLYTEDWVEYVAGERGDPVEPVEQYRFQAMLNGEAWKFTEGTSVELSC